MRVKTTVTTVIERADSNEVLTVTTEHQHTGQDNPRFWVTEVGKASAVSFDRHMKRLGGALEGES